MGNIKPSFIPNRLRNVSAEHPYVAGAVDIIDDVKNKNQQVINAEVDSTLTNHQQQLNNKYNMSDVYTKSEVNDISSAYTSQKYVTVEAAAATTASDIATLIATQAPDEKEAKDTLYRVACFDGTQYDTTMYSEYTYNGSDYILMGVKNPGIDDEPTAGSNNLVKSGGVKLDITPDYFIHTGQWLLPNGDVGFPTAAGSFAITDFLPIKGTEDIIVRAWCTIGLVQSPLVSPIHFYDEDYNFLWAWTDDYHSNWIYTIPVADIPNGAKYIRVTGNIARTPRWDAALIVKGIDLGAGIQSRSGDLVSILQQNASFCGLYGKKVSLLGDSLMAYGGLSEGPYDAMWYPANHSSDSGVFEIEHTWWGKLISLCGARLEKNEAYGSSCVTDNKTFVTSGYLDRVDELGNPDVILVSGGYNEPSDVGIGFFNPDEDIDSLNTLQFAPAYDKMVRLMKQYYPSARIIVVIYSQVPDRFADVMIRIASYYELDYVDLRPFEGVMTYITGGGAHPNRNGMDVICGQIVKKLSLVDYQTKLNLVDYFQINGKVINSVGNERDEVGDQFCCTPYLPIDKIKGISARVWYNNTAAIGIAYYDGEYRFISYESPSVVVGANDINVLPADIPATAVYFRCSGNRFPGHDAYHIHYGVGILDVHSLIPESDSSIKYFKYPMSRITQDGVTHPSGGETIMTTEYLPIDFIDGIHARVWYNWTTGHLGDTGLCFYDSDYNFISAHSPVEEGVAAVGDYDITIAPDAIPVGAVYFRCTGNSYYTHDSKIYYGVASMNPKSVSDAADGIKVSVGSEALIESGTVNESESGVTTYTRTGYMPCSAGSVISYETGCINNYPLAFYNASKEWIGYDEIVPGGVGYNVRRTVIAPANTAYIRLCGMNTSHAKYVPYNFSVIIRDYVKPEQNEEILAAYNSMKSISDRERLEHLVFDGIDDSYSHIASSVGSKEIDITEIGMAVCDDDTIDGYLGSTGFQDGFYSRAFPVMASVGAVISEAVECWRNGMVFEGELNKVGKVMKILVNKAGWEAMNHTCTARFYGTYSFATWDAAMTAINNGDITPVSGTITSSSNTHLYIEDRKLNYAYVSNEWIVVPACWIRPKLKNTSDVYIGDNPTFPYDFQINTSKKLIEKFLDTKVRVYNPTADAYSVKIAKEAFVNHRYVLHPTVLYGDTPGSDSWNNKMAALTINKFPIEPIVLRWNDFDNHTVNEDDNTDDGTMYAFWQDVLDEMISGGTKAVNIVAHHYRPCWANEISGSLPDGWKDDFADDSTPQYNTYPSEWVRPVRNPDDYASNAAMADMILYPNTDTNLTDWGNWYMDSDGLIHGTGWHPCPGTRLYSYWKFLLYAKSKGVKFMTLSDNMDRLRNAVLAGYKANVYNLGLANYDNPNQRYYIEGADGSIKSFVPVS